MLNDPRIAGLIAFLLAVSFSIITFLQLEKYSVDDESPYNRGDLDRFVIELKDEIKRREHFSIKLLSCIQIVVVLIVVLGSSKKTHRIIWSGLSGLSFAAVMAIISPDPWYAKPIINFVDMIPKIIREIKLLLDSATTTP